MRYQMVKIVYDSHDFRHVCLNLRQVSLDFRLGVSIFSRLEIDKSGAKHGTKAKSCPGPRTKVKETI